jgi:hypothetical protein
VLNIVAVPRYAIKVQEAASVFGDPLAITFVSKIPSSHIQ